MKTLGIVLFAMLGAQPMWASNALTVQGRIVAPSGVPVTAETDFTVRVRQGTCVLWEESFANVDLRATQGAFSLPLGHKVIRPTR
jgi:hypothetical protein